MKTQIQKDIMHYALCLMALLLIVPFNLSGRMLPYLDLYQDVFVVFTICFLFISVLSYGKLSLPLSRPAVYFLLLAGYWVLQSALLDLPYPDQNWRVALMFMALVALCWSIQALSQHYGREKIETWMLWAIVIGVAIQSVVVILQFTDIAKDFSGLIFSQKGIHGQLGQRNLLGHQLMWGVLAATYLTATARVRFWLGIAMIVFLGGIMGLVNSRTIVAYIVALLFFLTVARVIGGRHQGKVLKYLFFAVIWVFTAQWLIPFLLDLIGISAQSGVKRLMTNSAIHVRLIEWQKAWYIFLDNPIWGSGWHNYAYQSFLRDVAFKPEDVYHVQGYPDHCHNSVLQILAEMGGGGFTLVLGGLIWVTFPMLKHLRKGENQIILALLTVTLTHSMVEYPLWFTYYLAAAVIFIAVGQPQSKQPSKSIAVPHMPQLLLLVAGLSGMLMTGILFVSHQWHVSQLIKDTNDKVDIPTIRLRAGLQLGKDIPLLTPYKDFGILANAGVTDKYIDGYAAIANKLSRYQPTKPVVMLHGLYLYRQGKKQESLEWMKKVWNFYPRLVPYTMKTIYDASPMFKELEQPVYDTCVRLHRLNLYPKTFNSECLQPPDNIAQKDKAENAAQSVVESTAESTTEKDKE